MGEKLNRLLKYLFFELLFIIILLPGTLLTAIIFNVLTPAVVLFWAVKTFKSKLYRKYTISILITTISTFLITEIFFIIDCSELECILVILTPIYWAIVSVVGVIAALIIAYNNRT